MVDYLVVIGDGRDLVSNDSRLLFENSNSAHYFDPFVLLQVEVFERLGLLILSLLVENNLETIWIVANLNYCSHALLLNSKNASNNDNLNKKELMNN